MNSLGNFIITIIVITLAFITSIIYILTNIEPNIFWVVGLIALIGITITLFSSIIIYAFSKLRSFETPKEMYRRQIKKALIVGLVAMVALLAQKFFDLL